MTGVPLPAPEPKRSGPPQRSGPPRPHRLVGLASVLVDLVLGVPYLPGPGGDVLAGPPSAVVGGGRNVLLAARRAGLSAAYAGRHGTGPNGDLVRETLASDGIEVLAPRVLGSDTGLCVALVTPDGERTFVTAAGAEAHPVLSSLRSLGYQRTDAVAVSGYDLCYPDSAPVLTEWLRRPPEVAVIAFDPGPLIADIEDDVLSVALRATGLLTVNEREAQVLRERLGCTILGVLPHLAPDATIVVRRGAHGARLLAAGADPVDAVAPPVNPIDTNGAGDVHLGAMLAALSAGLGWADALRFGTVAAALSVTRRGPDSAPTLGAVRTALLANNPGRQ